jgi:putative transposase
MDDEDPKTVRRERPPDNAEIRKEMREIAAQRRRFGYRRIGVMLERKGHVMNHKKLYRLYREEGLSVRRRRTRKRARGSRTPMPAPLRPNDRWSMDFVADTFGASRRLRILAINDDACRENLCLLGDTSISGARVARDARRKLAVWRYDYNNVRPHSSLGNRTPAQARRAFLQDGSISPDALVLAGQHEYQTGRLSL